MKETKTTEIKVKNIGWPVFTDTIIDEVVVESEIAAQFIGCKIERVTLQSSNQKVKNNESI